MERTSTGRFGKKTKLPEGPSPYILPSSLTSPEMRHSPPSQLDRLSPAKKARSKNPTDSPPKELRGLAMIRQGLIEQIKADKNKDNVNEDTSNWEKKKIDTIKGYVDGLFTTQSAAINELGINPNTGQLIPTSTFADSVKRFRTNRNVRVINVKPGRPSWISATQISILQKDIYGKGMEGSGFGKPGAFKDYLEKYIRASFLEYGYNDWKTRSIEMSVKTIDDYYRKLCPETLQATDKQNKSRFLSRNDICKVMSQACTMYAAQMGKKKGLWPEDNTATAPWNNINGDAFSQAINENFAKGKCRVPKGVKKFLKAQKLSVKYEVSDMSASSMGPEEELALVNKVIAQNEKLKGAMDIEKEQDNEKEGDEIEDKGDEEEEEKEDVVITEDDLDYYSEQDNSDDEETDKEIEQVEMDEEETPDFLEGYLQESYNVMLKKLKNEKKKSYLRITPPGIIPTSRTLCKCGISRYVWSHAKGDWLGCIITLKQRKMTKGSYFIHVLNPAKHLYVAFRALEIDEKEFAIEKYVKCIFPSLKGNRENQYILDYLRSLKTEDDDDYILSDEMIAALKIESENAKIVFTQDGCGPELTAAMQLSMDSLNQEDAIEDFQTGLPKATTLSKVVNASTAWSQPHDVGPFHKNFKYLSKNDIGSYVEVLDDDRLPFYQRKIWDLLVKYGFKPSACRSYYKELINTEHRLNSAFNERDLRQAFATAVQCPFDLVKYIERYGGAYKLDVSDYQQIIDKFPILVNIADTCGGVHRSFMMSIMEDFIYEVHAKTLSPQARQLLYLQELQKPAELKSMGEFPAWNLNNKGYLEERKHQEEEALLKFQDKIAAEEAEKELKELAEKVKAAEAEELFDLACKDNEDGKFEIGSWLGKPKWVFKAEIYKKAWEVYCKDADNNKTPTTRDACIRDLKPVFLELMTPNDDAIIDDTI